MVKNLLISICLILISSCSTLAFWSDDDVDNLKPVELKSIQKDFSISVEWKKSLKGESNLSSFKPSYYSGNMLVADPEGNIVSLNPKTGNVWYDLSNKIIYTPEWTMKPEIIRFNKF